MITSQQIAWLAGLLEGEGCFRLHRKRGTRRGTVEIQLQMTDADVVREAARLLGSAVRGPVPSRPGHKDLFVTRVCRSHLSAGWMMTLYPFMGRRRRVKIAAILAHWRTTLGVANSLKRHCPRGHPYKLVIEGGLRRRRCPTCKRIREHSAFRRVESPRQSEILL